MKEVALPGQRLGGVLLGAGRTVGVFAEAGGTVGALPGAGRTIGSVETPLANPLAPFRIWMFRMLGSDRNPIPVSRRFGSVMTKDVSLEI